MSITISHDPADGTLVLGDPRPHHQLVKAAGFRFSRRIGTDGGWYFPHSRDKAPRVQLIERLAEQLRGVGFDVTVEIDDEQRTTEEREADRVARLADRQAGLERKAERKADEAAGHFATVDRILDMIPAGQPILVGHHSERRHRRDLERMDRAMGRGVEAAAEAREAARRAESSRATQQHRESAPATKRRIDRLEAELRDIDRKLTPCPTIGRRMKPEAAGQQISCPCGKRVTVGDDLLFPDHGPLFEYPEWGDRLRARRDVIEGDLHYWRQHLADLAAEGEVILGPDDFAKGDPVLANGHPGIVTRVSKKSVTVRFDDMPEVFTRPIPYDKVRKPQEAAAQ